MKTQGAQCRICTGPPASKPMGLITRQYITRHSASGSVHQARLIPALLAATLPPSLRLGLHPRKSVRLPATGTSAIALPKAERLVMDVGGRQIMLETGEIGRQANGAIVATMGETVLYATACCGTSPQGDGSFIPLSVYYQERFSAAGKTSGSFLKREGRPRDADVLVARLVDRPIRPMFEKGWANETQILEWVFSYDGIHEPEPLAITAAAAALLVSDIPLTKAVAGVQVGYIPDSGFVVNPTVRQMQQSQLDLMMAGTADAVLMIEGFCDWMTEEQMIQAVATGHAAISSMCNQLTEWAAKVGKKQKRPERLLPPAGLDQALKQLAAERVEAAYRSVAIKEERTAAISAIYKETLTTLRTNDTYSKQFPALDDMTFNAAWKYFESGIMRQLVLNEGIRMDGRKVTEIRPITSRADVLPRTHGSALFTRGETQALCVATLGSDSDAQKIDSIRGGNPTDSDGEEINSSVRDTRGLERFYLQYFFPPSSVGECGRVGPAGRRELGHGELAERALAPAVPPQSVFPYTVRVESTITESNGSSSMASVCGGCLAMLDAGVPMTDSVAGIAMGLILEPDGSYVVLSDIQGSEDALGDMDFKVAGSKRGISAFQMDIKVEGITLDIMKQALAQAAEGRSHILDAMSHCSPAPRRAFSPWAPKLALVQVSPEKLGQLIGPGGKAIRGIVAASGAADIVTNNNGTVQIVASSEQALAAAQELIALQIGELPVGTILRSRRVESIALFGVFVELSPGRSGLVHLSELAAEGNLTEVPPHWQVGSRIDVMYLGPTPDGKTRLSHKAVLLKDAGLSYTMPAPLGRARSSNGNDSSDGSSRGSSGGGRGQGSRGSSSRSSSSEGVSQPGTPRGAGERGNYRGGRGAGRSSINQAAQQQ